VDFPSNANSRHFRKSATAIAHLFGDVALKDSVHNALNHEKRTNYVSYQSSIRRHVVTDAKLKLSKLRKERSQDMKVTLQTDHQSR
jgi:hypothetical protein